MKKVLSIIVALSLLLSMVAVTITTVGATDNKDLENSTQYLIHELDRTQAGVIDGVVHGYMGDPDNDGDITIMDATEIQLFVARIKIPDEITSLLANVDNDDEVSIMDATQIQLYVARVISSDIINHALYTPYPPTEPPTELPTEPPTEAPTVEPTTPDTGTNVLHFDANSAGWDNSTRIYCYIWNYFDGQSFHSWHSKATRCTDNDGDGIWTYDLEANGITLNEEHQYAVIFSSYTGEHTYDLLFDYTVLGDTAYCDGTYYDTPEDGSNYKVAYWRGQNKHEFGPVMNITSIGDVIGTCIPRNTSAYNMFVDFLKYSLDNARIFSYKSDQTLLDDIALSLYLSRDNVKDVIEVSGVDVNWNYEHSYIDDLKLGTKLRAYHKIVDYLNANGDDYSTIYYYDDENNYRISIEYSSYFDMIIISGRKYTNLPDSKTLGQNSTIYISLNESGFKYSSSKDEYFEITAASIYSTEGYGSVLSDNPLSLKITRDSFSSYEYTYQQVESEIVKGLKTTLELCEKFFSEECQYSIYDLL